MYSECVRCQKLGRECDGPNFCAMPPQELIAWCKERKKHMGLTNAKLAELTGMSQGTIDSLLANTHADFKFGTISPLLRVLVGGSWLGDPCADPTGTASAELMDKIRALESEIIHKDKTIRDREEQIAAMTTLITNTNARYTKQTEELRAMIKDQNERHTKSQDFLRDQLRGRNTAVIILSVLLGICVLLIIGALVIDRLNPDIGFFWLDDLARLINSSSQSGPIA